MMGYLVILDPQVLLDLWVIQECLAKLEQKEIPFTDSLGPLENLAKMEYQEDPEKLVTWEEAEKKATPGEE